jgi:hypothetical protein
MVVMWIGKDLEREKGRASAASFLHNSQAHRLPLAIQVSCFEELTMCQVIFNKHR